ncbi:MAG: cysteine--tRNA ligase, partial [Thermoplasmata archaeon]|nr:cysteine--tRNA ligase [Thermoplasmata archaeon]
LCRYALNEFMKIANVLTLLQEKVALNEKAIKKLADKYKIRKNKAEEIIEEILNIRKKARMEKNYKLADEIRDDLKKAGIEIEDVGKETKWRIL